ncbi:hypothetical protein CDV31_016344 [Fusarium ambrosium]|uniref:MADS-box domain-containing protein n=1 Tax=Fusarium ambrosium TaxID=131363 RepID=A0A428SAN9_9HYPO|nr:hypothetical protein CDV31_016344 [Fusarium ambrosium]
MAPTTGPSQVTRTQTSRRRRSEQNRNPGAGMRNRKKGLSKKAHTFFRFYGGQVALVIKSEDGRIGGYESHAGLIREFAKASIPVGEFLGPEDFDKERSETLSEDLSFSSISEVTSGSSIQADLHTAQAGPDVISRQLSGLRESGRVKLIMVVRPNLLY